MPCCEESILRLNSFSNESDKGVLAYTAVLTFDELAYRFVLALVKDRYGHRENRERAWVLLVDKGFDGRTVRSDDLIPLIRRSGTVLAR